MRKKVKQLKIAYFRDKIDSCPDIRLGFRKIRSEAKEVVMVYSGNKRTELHMINSRRGQELIRINEEKEKYERILSKLESEWIDQYGTPCGIMKIKHYGVTANRRFFDDLKECCNTYKSDTASFYNGTWYKSKLESDFAKLMDEYGVMYKYEPEIIVTGTNILNPDFMLYLPWLDLLILVEIFGACSKVDYLNRNKLKLHKYLLSEWIPGSNMMALYYSDKTPYIREMVMEELENIELRRCLELLYHKNNSADWAQPA